MIVLTEKWMEEREWGKWRDGLPKGFVWKIQRARRKSMRGRAMGDMLMGIRKENRIVGVYVNGDIERKLEGLREWMESKENGVRTLFGGRGKDKKGGW